MTLDSYFNETSPEEYRFLGFYEYRQKQDDFTFSFQKEALRLRRSLDYLLEGDCSEDVKRNVEKLKKSFEASFLLFLSKAMISSREDSQ